MAAISRRTLAVAVLAVLLAALVSAAVVLLSKGDDNSPIKIILPTPGVAGGQGPAGGAQPPDQAKAEAEIGVYVTGQVHFPGIYFLRAGDRLGDAIAAAGGATTDADLAAINLALRVRDEVHYHVPRVGDPPRGVDSIVSGPSTPPGGIGPPATGGLIDLNTAPAELLQTLPGIGRVRAQAIVEDRQRNGPFSSVEGVTRVAGIGPAIYEKIRDLVTVQARP